LPEVDVRLVQINGVPAQLEETLLHLREPGLLGQDFAGFLADLLLEQEVERRKGVAELRDSPLAYCWSHRGRGPSFADGSTTARPPGWVRVLRSPQPPGTREERSTVISRPQLPARYLDGIVDLQVVGQAGFFPAEGAGVEGLASAIPRTPCGLRHSVPGPWSTKKPRRKNPTSR
jgi:hypothetical protein